MSVAFTWGTSESERALPFPCDSLLEGDEIIAYRGVTVAAPPAVVFRWLCQLRVAPYSYDWIDNFGRRSPRSLTPGVDALEVGQRFMTIFDLVSFERPGQLTLRMRSGASRMFGETLASYVVIAQGDASCRLLVKLAVRPPRGLWGALLARWLPWGDLVMMRRQLLNLKSLSEAMTG